MAGWEQLRRSNAALADAGERLLRANREGFAFLATVRKDGGPRMHPVVPVLSNGRLYVFVVNLSPKYEDLLRDGRFALHAMLPEGGGEEFYVTGRAVRIEEPSRRAQVTAASGDRLGHRDFEVLFELGLRRVLHARWVGWGTPQIRPELQALAGPLTRSAGFGGCGSLRLH